MATQYENDVLTRMTTGFELFELAEGMMRQNLRRWYPEESDEAREQRLIDWRLGRSERGSMSKAGSFRQAPHASA